MSVPKNILFLLPLQVILVKGSTYVIRRTNVLENALNWEDGNIPCEGDRIRFEDKKVTTALANGDGLKTLSIDLPDDGIIFFGERMEMGKPGSWQCKMRPEPEEVYFKRSPPLAFHNGSNWAELIGGQEIRPILHALQVPSSQDVAVIAADSSSRILIDDFVTVGTLMFANKVSES
ncbi:unnamed protein product [Gongylonema pulchrum]|uniref:Protein amnionless n=1 Tax=Gongylonema pulchrum TaxID=637853 RepID=A0A183CYD8_9BILA|nr:unnamed protein product [Gongylonema pulchrum]